MNKQLIILIFLSYFNGINCINVIKIYFYKMYISSL